MANAVDEFKARCKCHVNDGERDVSAIMSESFDEEVYDWFVWNLVDKYVPMELIREHFEDMVRDALFEDVGDEIQEMVNEAEEEEDEEW